MENGRNFNVSLEEAFQEIIPEEIYIEDIPVTKSSELEGLSPISLKTLRVAEYYGPCGGVNAAIKTLQEAFDIIDGRTQIHTHNPVVHNNRVNQEFIDRGLVIHHEKTETGDYDMSGVSEGDIWAISAHGCKPEYIEALKAKGCTVLDLTCPLVDVSHKKARDAESQGKKIILFGAIKNGIIHPEPNGIMGEVDPENITFISSQEDAEKLQPDPDREHVWIPQTTQSTREIQVNLDIVQEKIPNIKVAGGTLGCYATDHRQDAMVSLAQKVQRVMVITSEISNNGTNLIKRAEEQGVPAHLIQGEWDIKWAEWFAPDSGIEDAGLSAAASSPQWMVDNVINEFKKRGVNIVYEIPDNPENPETTFKLRRANLKALEEKFGKRS